MEMDKRNFYFVGIGGIGMSAIARFFLHEGYAVAGYDRMKTALTEQLETEGAQIDYTDSADLIPPEFRSAASTRVIYTPAIPSDSPLMDYFRRNGFRMLKRSEVLGLLSGGKYVMAVAGTHGKTTTTTLTAWINRVAADGGCAFLGGISRNFQSNLVLGEGSRFAVEADEFDRSFLTLHPDCAVVTAADADHLDIYSTHERLREAFAQFIRQIKPGGTLIIKQGVDVTIDNREIKVWRYSLDDLSTDFHAENIRLVEGGYHRFDIVTPTGRIDNCTLGIPGLINVENAVAAVALTWCAGVDRSKLREALESFRGVKRRFEFYINTPRIVYMDDYAHHPRELAAALGSLHEMFPSRKITAIFQPHLYTRTRDMYRDFAASLSLADEVILLPIYPAREEPIEGITSAIIADLVTVPHRMIAKERVAREIEQSDVDVVVSFGAGDIDGCCADIAARLMPKS